MSWQIHHVLSKTPLVIRVVSLYVVVGSIAWFYLSVTGMTSVVEAARIATNTTTKISMDTVVVQPKYTTGQPRNIKLPRIGLDLAVVDGQYDAATKAWTLTEDKAQYAVMTAPVNNHTGQTLIYGHNTVAVLEPVRQVLPGDELLVTTDNGRVLKYTYSHDRFVDPSDMSVLKENPDKPRVVLMTCEGWLSTTRRLLYFDFERLE